MRGLTPLERRVLEMCKSDRDYVGGASWWYRLVPPLVQLGRLRVSGAEPPFDVAAHTTELGELALRVCPPDEVG